MSRFQTHQCTVRAATPSLTVPQRPRLLPVRFTFVLPRRDAEGGTVLPSSRSGGGKEYGSGSHVVLSPVRTVTFPAPCPADMRHTTCKCWICVRVQSHSKVSAPRRLTVVWFQLVPSDPVTTQLGHSDPHGYMQDTVTTPQRTLGTRHTRAPQLQQTFHHAGRRAEVRSSQHHQPDSHAW
mgnify:CR=1 FL=1